MGVSIIGSRAKEAYMNISEVFFAFKVIEMGNQKIGTSNIT